MKRIFQAILVNFYIISTHSVAGDVDLNLEPCINGGVSASGDFVSQQAEDAHKDRQRELAKQHELEPCIDGGVSASGLYPSQEAEDRQERDYLEGYGRFGAFE